MADIRAHDIEVSSGQGSLHVVRVQVAAAQHCGYQLWVPTHYHLHPTGTLE